MDSQVKEKRKLTEADQTKAAEFIINETERRAQDRKDREKQWDEVDRQVRMEPVYKRTDPKWIPRLELPLQAEAKETLTADTRRLIFPADRDFFLARAALTADDLPRLSFDRFVGGKQSPIQNMIAERGPQDFANKLCVATLQKFHTVYNFRKQWDALNGEAFKYGSYIGRVQITEQTSYSGKKWQYPALTALSVREFYLDDSPAKLFQDGIKVGPGMIRRYFMKIADLVLASKDKSEGWIADNLTDIESNARGVPKGHVELIEFDGDLVFPDQTSGDVFIPGVTVTVCKANQKVARIRYRKFDFSPYIYGTYDEDAVGSCYGTSPLIKGVPIQNSATRALIDLMSCAALNALPPVKYDQYDQNLAAKGGPVLEPRAQWPANSKPEPVQIGDLNGLLEVYTLLLKQYENETGVNSVRLGEQTKSHQTAFAIDREETRGMVRTVDYVESIKHGSMADCLAMEYEMAKTLGPMTINIPDYDGFVIAAGKNLPETVEFIVTGAGTPLEAREQKAAMIQSMQAFLQTEAIARQLGATPGNIDEVRRQILRFGGVLETDRFLPGPGTGGAAAASTGLPGFLAGGSAIPGLGEGVPA